MPRKPAGRTRHLTREEARCLTAAVWMAEAGVPMADIAHYFGHDDSRITTRIYARYAPDHLRDAAEALEL